MSSPPYSPPPPPNGGIVIRADSPSPEPPPAAAAAIPSPSKSRVVCFGPKTEGVLNINSFKPADPPSQANPKPRLSGSRWGPPPLHSRGPFEFKFEEDDETNPRPLRSDAFDAAGPICAAFCSSAVADMAAAAAGCGGAGAYCLRSWPAVPKVDDKQRDIGSEDGGPLWSFPEWNKFAKPFVREWMVPEDVDEANRLANTLLLELPLVLELQLGCVEFVREGGVASSNNRVVLSRISAKCTTSRSDQKRNFFEESRKE